MPQLSIKGEDLNFLVYRYLVENGYQHSAFCFRNESNLPNYLVNSAPSRGKPSKYPPQCLIGLIYKAILFIWVETHTDQTTGEEIPCDAPFNLFKSHVCSHGASNEATAATTSDDLFREAEDDQDAETPQPLQTETVERKPLNENTIHTPDQFPLPKIDTSHSSQSNVTRSAADLPIPRKVLTPDDVIKKPKREAKEHSMDDTQSAVSDNDEPISVNRRRRLFSHVRSMSYPEDDQQSDQTGLDNAAKKMAIETPKRSGGIRPGRPRKENAYQVIRRGPQGYVLGFRVDREQVIIGKKSPPEGWRIAAVLTNSSNAIPKRVEVNSGGRLMVVLWLNEATDCYDCHLYEIDETDEFHFVKLGVEAQQLMNIQAVKFSSSRPAFRIILAGRREGTSIYKTFGKHEEVWKLESETQHP